MTMPSVRFDASGLIPAIAVCKDTKAVLMLAYMNEESLALTLKTGYVHYYSRSRGKIWKKGEVSGHTQRLESLWVDCDADAILVEVEQKGACCHEGYPSCFFRKVDAGPAEHAGIPRIELERKFDPKEVYGKRAASPHALDKLFSVIESRKASTPEESYVASLFAKGPEAIEAKVQEEIEELFEAARQGDDQHTIHEAADVLFHTLVLLSHSGIPAKLVWEELERRSGTSGHEEKRRRSSPHGP